jgi:hypothetical protein
MPANLWLQDGVLYVRLRLDERAQRCEGYCRDRNFIASEASIVTNFAETAAPFAWPTSLSVFDGAHVVEVGSH